MKKIYFIYRETDRKIVTRFLDGLSEAIKLRERLNATFPLISFKIGYEDTHGIKFFTDEN